jgi:hypothetical protein
MYVPTYTHDQEEEIDLKVYKNNEKTPYKKNHKMNTIKEERDDGNNSDGSDTAYFNGEDDTFNNRDDEDEEEEDKELDNRYD